MSPEPCPDAGRHTPMPDGIVARQSWAEAMRAQRSKQARCLGCGRWVVWFGFRAPIDPDEHERACRVGGNGWPADGHGGGGVMRDAMAAGPDLGVMLELRRLAHVMIRAGHVVADGGTETAQAAYADACDAWFRCLMRHPHEASILLAEVRRQEAEEVADGQGAGEGGS